MTINEADREKLLRQLMTYDFAEKELNLFLDTHPMDMKALEMHKSVAEKTMELRAEYVGKYGALSPNECMSTEQWHWIDGPWPWEN